MQSPMLILSVIIVLGVCQLIGFLVLWDRVWRVLRTQDPLTTTLVIHSFSSQTGEMAHVLARRTRLDLSEIDELIEERRIGPLPVRFSYRQAMMLATELRGLGVEVEVRR